MHLKDWLQTATKEQREELATKCNTTTDYLYQIAGGHRPGSGPLVRKLSECSAEITPEKVISKHLMRPDIFEVDAPRDEAA